MRCAVPLVCVWMFLGCGPEADGTGSTGGAQGTSGPDTDTASVGSTEADGGESTAGLACARPSCEQYPAPCDGACGRAESPFDADGCLRGACTDDADCDPGARCFRGADFGLCEPSGLACDDAAQGCICTAADDCGGGHCIPAELYPEPEAPPQGVFGGRRGCSGLWVWSAPAATGACEPDGPESISLQLVHREGAIYDLDPEASGSTYQPDGDEAAEVIGGSVTFDAALQTNGPNRGQYGFLYAGADHTGWVTGAFEEAWFCDGSLAPCG